MGVSSLWRYHNSHQGARVRLQCYVPRRPYPPLRFVQQFHFDMNAWTDELLGGGNRLSYYVWTGAPLTAWSTAEGNEAGRYDFIMSAPLLPLISTVGINEKVVFVEKHGTQVYDNSSGSFEFDPTLAPQYGKAFRELQLKTDVLCSASLVLPDKAGRQINVGGWSLESLYGVRLFTARAGLR